MKNISAVIMVLTRLIVLLFQFSISLSSGMHFGVIYLETGQANNPNLHSWHFNFTLVCFS